MNRCTGNDSSEGRKLLAALARLAVIGLLSASASAAPGRSEDQIQAPGARTGSLAAASSGPVVVIAWYASRGTSTDVVVALSADGGRSFSSTRRLGTASPTDAAPKPVVAVLPPAGRGEARGVRIMIAWPAERLAQPGVAHAVSNDSGQSFEESFFRSQGVPSSATVSALSLGPTGQLHVLWQADSRLMYARARGQTLSELTQLDASASSCGVSAVIEGPHNTVSVLWHRNFGATEREFAYLRSTDGGASFGSVVRISRERWRFRACPGVSPSLSVDTKGARRFVFQAVIEGEQPTSRFFADRSSDGKAFRPRAFVEVAGFTDARAPQLLPDGEGGLTLVWDGIRNNRRYVMIKHSLGAPQGGGGLDADWMRPAPPIVLDQSGHGSGPVLARVADGVLVAWLIGSADKRILSTRRFGIEELCGLPSKQ